MIQKKYKLSDFIKDMNLSSQEVTDLLQKVDATPKKPTATMSDDELDLAFEHFTKAASVESFDDYFELLKGKTAKAPVKAEASTTPTQATSPQATPPQATRNTNAPRPLIPNTNTARTVAQNTNAPRPLIPNTNQPRPLIPNTNAPRPQGQNTNAPRPQGQNTNAPRPQGQNTNPPRQQAAQSTQAPRTGTAFIPNRNKAASQNPDFYSSNNARAPKPVQRPTATSQRPQQTGFGGTAQPAVQGRVETTTDADGVAVRHVDTRTVEVNLDKYNERYEQIPGQAIGRNDTYQRKQKLNQKSQQRAKQKFSNKKETEAQKLQRMALERARKQQLRVLIPDEITVVELATRLKATAADVIKKLIGLGVMAAQTDIIDFDTASLVSEEMGAKVEREVIVTVEERLIDYSEDTEEALELRSPVVVVMGHVDHGKTSLLDKIRNADVTSTEAGGITQHIGAYTVSINNKPITFLDTPGHEAFTSMRARGALITDIAILVVAADDGIMPQTIEAINHAKAAGVSIIVAINKMDKPHANPDKVMQELTEHELLPEAWGGDVICCPVSAITGEGIPQLLEYVTLVADLADLRANPNRLANGTVIEARLDKGRGPVATLLVQNGTLKTGDVIIAGASVGRVRVMTSDKGAVLEAAGPSTPVEITGLAEVPSAGDVFNAVEDERLARTLVDQRKYDQKEEVFKQYHKVTLDNLFNSIADGEIKELPIIVKADVQGSAEAVKQSLEKLTTEEIRVRVIHNGVGAVKKSDVMLAQASGAIIIGFNVRPDQNVRDTVAEDDVEIRLYRIIYDAIEDVKQAMKGMLDPKTREVELGRAEVRQVYKITNVGVVAGCYVREGKVVRNALIRVVRDGIVLAEDKIDSLKRFKDDQKEVATGYECGIGLDKFNDVKEGDIFESFIIEEYRD